MRREKVAAPTLREGKIGRQETRNSDMTAADSWGGL